MSVIRYAIIVLPIFNYNKENSTSKTIIFVNLRQLKIWFPSFQKCSKTLTDRLFPNHHEN